MQLRRPAHDRTRIEAGIVGPDGGEIVDRPLLGLAPDGTDHIDRVVQPIGRADGQVDRSEEHTSELQSLMRISYAVFCLKKKKQTITQSPPMRKEAYKQEITRRKQCKTN